MTAAREALINSDGFEILAKRAADRLHHDEVEQAECGASISSTPAMGLRSAEVAVTAIEEEGATDNSRTRAGEWKRNADKLKSLRLTVLESRKAREIAGKLLVRLDNNRDRCSTSGRNERRLDELHHATSPPHQQEIIQDTPKGSSFDEMAERQDAKREAAAMEGGWESSPRSPGIRWFRRIATRVSRVGRQARAKVARVYSRESRTTDDMIRRDA